MTTYLVTWRRGFSEDSKGERCVNSDQELVEHRAQLRMNGVPDHEVRIWKQLSWSETAEIHGMVEERVKRKKARAETINRANALRQQRETLVRTLNEIGYRMSDPEKKLFDGVLKRLGEEEGELAQALQAETPG